MKYGIDTLHVILNEDDRKSIAELLFGEPMEVHIKKRIEHSCHICYIR